MSDDKEENRALFERLRKFGTGSCVLVHATAPPMPTRSEPPSRIVIVDYLDHIRPSNQSPAP